MPRWALSRQATLVIAGATLVLSLVSVGARWQLSTAWEASDEVVRTQKVLAATEQLLGRLLDAETGQRGYLITGQETYLEAFRTGREAVQSDIARLQSLTAADAEQAKRLQSISVLTTVKLDELQRSIDARQSQGVEAANALVAGDVGRLTMDRLRALLGEVDARARSTLEARLRTRGIERRRLANILFAGAIAGLALLLAAVLALNRTAAERLLAERRVRENEERLRTTLRSIGDAVIATDANGRVVFINPVAQDLTGWGEPAAIGQPLDAVFVIVNEETRATVESPVGKVLREEAIVGLANHTVLIARDGREVPIDDSGAPIRDADSAVMGVVLVFRDVSDRKAMEWERETRARAETEIVAAQAARDAAESANLAKDQFLAVLSHELRSPLNVIVSWLVALRRGLEGPQLERALDTLERNVRLQAQLINDLLDVSRIVSGKLSLERGVIDMEAVMRTAIDNARPIAVARGISLQTRIEPLGGSVQGDAQRLLQVVTNLLNNALKFTPGGGRVEVSLFARDCQACIDVVDTGIGIAPEFLPHVFDRFRQSDESDARGHGGLGLGLSIVKHLVERHGGTVEARSDGIGTGATFSVCLPLDSTPVQHSAQILAAPQPDGPTDLSDLHVLVVDDDADTREGLRLALEIYGARVTVADSVTAALEALAQERPHAVISDIGMPGGTGLDLIRTIREEIGSLPAIAISGYASREDRDVALAAGFTEHLTKPVDLAVLLGNLRRVAPAPRGEGDEA
ncbi:MAG TPA: CHASE3 domain-containing protein [Candidatus Dormibacteraeota bacterium]|nr:CHASE3 domain-containing protein [Candidatus Dormibacteraeota bacterium]